MKKLIYSLLTVIVIIVFVGCSSLQTTASAPENKLEKDYVIDPVNDWAVYDALVADIKAEADTAKRAQMMHEAEDIIMATNCIIPIFYNNDVYMVKDYVEGLYSDVNGIKYFQDVKMNNGSKTLRVNLINEPYSLDPAYCSSYGGLCIAANSFSGLYKYNAEGKTVPDCAEGYTVTPDGLTYTVKLKSGLKWSDGTPLTAKDFEYSWKRTGNPETYADWEIKFMGFDGYEEGDINVKAIDDTTLVFVLSERCPYIEDLMAFPTFYPVKRSEVEASDGWCDEPGFASNGPFVCTSWNHNVSMTYEKNPYWHGASDVEIEKIEVVISDPDETVFDLYNAGKLDFLHSVSKQVIKKFHDNPEFYSTDLIGVYYTAVNCKGKIFEGKTAEQANYMRKAFQILINRDYICQNAERTGWNIANAFIPQGISDGNGGIFRDESSGYFDAYGINNNTQETLEKAIALLEAAGYRFENGKLSEETPLNIVYLTSEGYVHVDVAEAIKKDFATLGIELTIQVEPNFSSWWNVKERGNYDFTREGWFCDYNDPVNILEMCTTDSEYNDCRFGLITEPENN